MFTARAVIVCLALFGVMYGAISFAVAAFWFAAQRLIARHPSSNPNVLFGLRVLPFGASALFAVFFTFPSFWLMERRALDEDVTTFFLAMGALVLLSAGATRAVRASRRTTQRVSQWLRKTGGRGKASATTLSTAHDAPALMLVGIWRPKVVVSDTAMAALTENELRLAIRHELGHRRSCDNLKKLLMNAIPFPGTGGIERAWREAAELAADGSAVENRQDALDLASALIKLSRPAKWWSEPETASAFVCGSSAVAMRVQHLLNWRSNTRLYRTWPWALLFVLVVTAIVSNYGTALLMTHRLTELLVP